MISETQLKDRNKNPWYILMTLHGEQTGDSIDQELAEKNRKLWNAWACQGLDDVTRMNAVEASKILVNETVWTVEKAESVRQLFGDEWRKRNNDDDPPELPTLTIRLSCAKSPFPTHLR